MEFDPKRAARVGAKKLRQRQETRLAKRQIDETWIDDIDLQDRIKDSDAEDFDLEMNIRASMNRKRFSY